MKIKILLLCVFFIAACSKSTPRKPINPKPSTTIFQKNIEETKLLHKIEEEKIIQLIKKDSTKKYKNSTNGFWYSYINKVDENLPNPQKGNIVTIAYDIRDLNDSIIYSKEELGNKEYNVDKEDFISGIQKGIKLMKVGETITFVIPSYNAFGISGDGNRIGINQSIKSTVTLINIK